MEPMGVIEGVDSVVVAAAYELSFEAHLEAVLSAMSRALISEYCVVVVAANWSKYTLMFVAVPARLSK